MLQDRGLSSQPGLLEKVLELKETRCSSYLLAFLFDCYEDALENSSQKGKSAEDREDTLKRALEVSGSSGRVLFCSCWTFIVVPWKSKCSVVRNQPRKSGPTVKKKKPQMGSDFIFIGHRTAPSNT